MMCFVGCGGQAVCKILFLTVSEVYFDCENVGRKSGKGIFLYEEKAKNREENPGAQEIMKRFAQPPKQQYVLQFAALEVIFLSFGCCFNYVLIGLIWICLVSLIEGSKPIRTQL